LGNIISLVSFRLARFSSFDAIAGVALPDGSMPNGDDYTIKQAAVTLAIDITHPC